MEDKLTDQEKLFCELYVTGDAPFAGDASRCYYEAFSCAANSRNKHKALLLLSKDDIQQYVEELEKLKVIEAKSMKRFLAENLKNIVSECSKDTYVDKRGAAMSPAALRSVAVNASKALMELYPVKEAQVSKLSLEGAEGSGIVFNVVVPEKPAEIQEE